MRRRLRLSSIWRRASSAVRASNLGGQRHFLAPGRHHPPDALLALAVAVGMRGVDVGDAEINRAVERLEGLVLVLVHEKPAAGAEAEDRHFEAGAAERARGQFAAVDASPAPGRQPAPPPRLQGIAGDSYVAASMSHRPPQSQAESQENSFQIDPARLSAIVPGTTPSSTCEPCPRNSSAR